MLLISGEVKPEGTSDKDDVREPNRKEIHTEVHISQNNILSLDEETNQWEICLNLQGRVGEFLYGVSGKPKRKEI